MECKNCNNDVTPVVYTNTKTISGSTICSSYTEHYAVCPVCKGALHIEFLEAKNTLNYERAVRRSNGILSASKLREIRRKAKVSKKDIAKALGYKNPAIVDTYESGAQPPSLRYNSYIMSLGRNKGITA